MLVFSNNVSKTRYNTGLLSKRKDVIEHRVIMTQEAHTPNTETDFYDNLHGRAEEIDGLLMQTLSELKVGAQFREVLEYAMSAPGKRIRAILLLWTYEMIKGSTC